jgi:NAD(P)-dependent dehydrogenase (short-subunit alcohol dehydrogenase family)
MISDQPSASVPAIEGLFRLDGQVAVVTGGGGSLGRTASHVLSQAGAAVVVADRDREAAERVRVEIAAEGGQTAVREWDVTLEPVVAAGFGQVLEEYGRLDVLVNSVGGGKHVPAMEMSLADWNEVLTRNLTSTFLCCREAGRRMAARGGGSIVNISSIMGHSGGGLYPNSAYHASKGAVVNLTRALAAEWGRHGVRVNEIAPTFTDTPLAASILHIPEMRTAIEEYTPLRRVAQTGDMAGAVLYLASSASSMVTGHSLFVDGGWLAR